MTLNIKPILYMQDKGNGGVMTVTGNAVIEIMGPVEYRKAMDIQYAEKQRVVDNGGPGKIFFLEHYPPVITLGRHSTDSNVLFSGNALKERGYELLQTNRGGDVTVHEPGQLVVYYVVPVKSKNTVSFVNGIIDPVVEALNDHLGTELYYSEKKPGVWQGAEKCISVGFDLRQGVSMHGIAVNVCNTLEGFSLVNPCGMPSGMMTTLSRITGRSITVAEICRVLAKIYTTPAAPAPPYPTRDMNF